MTQTAIQWLFRWFMDNHEATSKEANEAFEQAKQMEKEQIENAWCNGFDEDDRATSNPFKYYEQTYGGKP